MAGSSAAADGWKELSDMPDDLHVLFIEGYCEVPWMQDKFWTGAKIGPAGGPFESSTNFRVWCTDPSHLREDNIPPNAFGVERCTEEIKSGRYHAIVAVDVSNVDSMKDLERDFGELLQTFVREGGVIAFPSSESLVVSMLKDYFGVSWRRSDYYRTTWGPCPGNENNINYSFGNGNLARRVIAPYSAKGNTLRCVPPHERCFGVTPESRTQSLVPMMAGRDVSAKEGEDDYDVIIAMHDYGKGAVAYFGDVNGEDRTLWLVTAFVESRSPRFAVDCFSRFSDEIFSEAMQLKEQGNYAFKENRLDDAVAFYTAAIEKFGNKLGAHGPQRDGYVSVYSNLALMYLKMNQYHDAESAATKGLEIDKFHGKCSFRRAVARFRISSDTGGDLTRLRGAQRDLLEADICSETQKLMEQLRLKIDRLEKKEGRSFSSGFAAAVSGSLKHRA